MLKHGATLLHSMVITKIKKAHTKSVYFKKQRSHCSVFTVAPFLECTISPTFCLFLLFGWLWRWTKI